MPGAREFQFTAARDLVGILRAMWANERGRSYPKATKLRTIEKLAAELQKAIALAATHDAGTEPYAKAVSLAEGVAKRLADVVELTDPVMPVLEAAARRVRGRRRKAAGLPRWAVGRRKGAG